MAIRNKMAKPFPMWSKGSIIIAQFSKYKITISQNRRSFSMLSVLKMLSIFSGSRGPDGPDLPLPFKFQVLVHTRTTCLMMGEVSLETSPKNIDSRHDKLKTSMNTTESTNTNIFKSSVACFDHHSD